MSWVRGPEREPQRGGGSVDARRITSTVQAIVILAATLGVAASLVTVDGADPPFSSVFPPHPVVHNLCGAAGSYLAWTLLSILGAASWLFVAAGLSRAAQLLSDISRVPRWQSLVGWCLVMASTSTMLHEVQPGLGGGYVVGSGGYLGAWCATWLDVFFVPTGRGVLLLSMLVSGLVLSGEWRQILVLFRWTVAPLGWLMRLMLHGVPRENDPVDRKLVEPIRVVESSQVDDVELAPTSAEVEPHEGLESVVSPPHRVTVHSTVSREDQDSSLQRIEVGSRRLNDSPELPGLGMLEDPEDFPYALLAKKAQLAAITLEQTFQDFGLNVRVVAIDTGPVITQFELELEAGLRLSKVSRLADDLAIALRVPSVRVVASIPGKNTVGIEVPNERRVMVRLRELIESSSREVKGLRLPVFLGKDVSGRPQVIDLARMPHLLIAGRTGTGKSVCLNSLIVSLLMTRRSDEVKMLMIDPKMVELSPYCRIPHLMHPVITDMKKAEAVLAWAVDKMEERYDLLARCGVRHLDGFNRLDREEVLDRLGLDEDDDEDEVNALPQRMPYIVIVADEMADLMMSAGKDIEGHIIRLAQKSRAVGIHLVLATQKPTVDVITGLIKSNLPARVSFQVASRTDSRVVLDQIGADKLLGNGDMLYMAPGTSTLHRAQGTFVSDEEVNAVIDFFREQVPQYSEELAQLPTGGQGGLTASGLPDRDELYEQAIEVVIREGRGSVSLLQRCLGIGYGRAARLVDYMAEDGIVGDYNGSQAREVLYSPEQWETFQAGQHSSQVPLETGS